MCALGLSVLSAILLIGQAGAGPAITGAVLDPTGQPVVGAEVVLTAGEAPDGSVPILAKTATDASGAFRLARPSAEDRLGFLAPGVIWAYKAGLGLGVVNLIRADRPDQVHRLVLEPQELRRVTIRDQDGKPIVGVTVAARLVETERTGYLGVTVPDNWHHRLTAVTDDQGVASLPGLTRRIELRSVRMTGAAGGAQVAMLLYSEGKHEASLTLGRPVRLAGAVRDASGAPISGVAVEVWGRCGFSFGNGQFSYVIPEPVRFDSGPVRTVANGSFQTPPLLRAGSTYRLVVRADGFATAISDWITFRGESNAMPPLTLRALRTLAGRVVDRQGRPIASVQVFQPGNGPSATTDDAGRFQLEAVRSGRSILVARREGFRFGGTLIDDKDSSPVELTLSRPGEPPDRKIATLPGPIPQEESRAWPGGCSVPTSSKSSRKETTRPNYGA